jgi:ABC transporter substrate binding protein
MGSSVISSKPGIDGRVFQLMRLRTVPAPPERRWQRWVATAVLMACVGSSPTAFAAPPLIGYLAFGQPGEPTACADALKLSLKRLGLSEERDYRFTIRYAFAKESGLRDAAKALAAEKPALLVSAGINPVLALRDANPGVPVVTMGTGAMIEQRLIASFARPGANITGISSSQHAAKQIELVLMAFPKVARIGLVANRGNVFHATMLPVLAQRARGAGTSTALVWIDGVDGIDAAYDSLRAQGVRHAAVLPDWLPHNRLAQRHCRDRLSGWLCRRWGLAALRRQAARGLPACGALCAAHPRRSQRCTVAGGADGRL